MSLAIYKVKVKVKIKTTKTTQTKKDNPPNDTSDTPDPSTPPPLIQHLAKLGSPLLNNLLIQRRVGLHLNLIRAV